MKPLPKGVDILKIGRADQPVRPTEPLGPAGRPRRPGDRFRTAVCGPEESHQHPPLNRQPFAPFAPPAGKNFPSVRRLHAGTKTDFSLPFLLVRLPRSFHR